MKYKNLGIKPYNKGLVELGNHTYAYLQPDGGWGWSNAGLIADSEQAMVLSLLLLVKELVEVLQTSSL